MSPQALSTSIREAVEMQPVPYDKNDKKSNKKPQMKQTDAIKALISPGDLQPLDRVTPSLRPTEILP
jgi:hypothetical protein